MKINQLPIYFVLLLLFGGCSQMTFDDSVTVISKSIQDLRIAPGNTPITADEAIKVALLFDSNQGRPITKSDEKEVYTRIQNGKPVFYVVKCRTLWTFICKTDRYSSFDNRKQLQL